MNVANRRREHQAFFFIVNVLTATPKIRSSPDLWKHETDIQPQIVRNRRTCFRRSDSAPSGNAVLQATPIEPKFVSFFFGQHRHVHFHTTSIVLVRKTAARVTVLAAYISVPIAAEAVRAVH